MVEQVLETIEHSFAGWMVVVLHQHTFQLFRSIIEQQPSELSNSADASLVFQLNTFVKLAEWENMVSIVIVQHKGFIVTIQIFLKVFFLSVAVLKVNHTNSHFRLDFVVCFF